MNLILIYVKLFYNTFNPILINSKFYFLFYFYLIILLHIPKPFNISYLSFYYNKSTSYLNTLLYTYFIEFILCVFPIIYSIKYSNLSSFIFIINLPFPNYFIRYLTKSLQNTITFYLFFIFLCNFIYRFIFNISYSILFIIPFNFNPIISSIYFLIFYLL